MPLFTVWSDAPHRIISDDKELTSARILLCRRLKQAFRQGLTLLGITPLEEM
ncbi:MAG: DALR anticodon-binding domain-containing protein [Planctomycetota bacterium]